MSKEFAKTLGQRIRAIREDKLLSRDTVAAHAGFHPNFIGYVERGQQCPSAESLVRIAAALDVEVGDLINADKGRSRRARRDVSRSTEEIEAMIARIEADDRYNSPPANVAINAPLALIQVELKATAGALRWMLGEPHHLDESSRKVKR